MKETHLVALGLVLIVIGVIVWMWIHPEEMHTDLRMSKEDLEDCERLGKWVRFKNRLSGRSARSRRCRR
jgi:hypothetical protein